MKGSKDLTDLSDGHKEKYEYSIHLCGKSASIPKGNKGLLLMIVYNAKEQTKKVSTNAAVLFEGTRKVRLRFPFEEKRGITYQPRISDDNGHVSESN